MSTEHDREECEKVFALLSDYLDLELPADACSAIGKHLADCPPCIEFAETLRKAIALCRQFRPEQVPQPLGAEAKEQLRRAWLKLDRDRLRPE